MPNDPRGSYSKEIYNAQLRALGRIKYGKQNPRPAKDRLLSFWTVTRPHIRRPPFFIDDSTRPIIAAAFATVVQRLGVTVPACAIMNDHIHVLVLRSRHKIEYLVNQLKGAATGALGLKRTCWARGCWKVFITDRAALLAAGDYIQANPAWAGLGAQHWDFINPLPV